MNTTAAAQTAGVTVATIRHWCRTGVVAAAKAAGRWIIEAASLAYRVTLGKERRMSHAPVEHRVDDTTTVIATYSDQLGPACWRASEYRNGHHIGTIGDGQTAQEAINHGLDMLRRLAERDAAAEALENSGLYADLTLRSPGIMGQLADAIPSPAPAGECHYCGLDERTCDCR
ncbi:hypothetical protein [Nonomuraea typhae]|uniref:hypothetical protein n=1 Tax=Nonomuraea typhae TaxID=2603600 RepID=UPI0012FB12AA|nr:hypothetical protein [Nonomuraea typhae]